MKKIILPEKAFPHKKTHVICGHQFKDGHIIVPNDVGDKVCSMFKRFYGAAIEDIPDPIEEDPSQDDSGDASLAVSNTKTSEAA